MLLLFQRTLTGAWETRISILLISAFALAAVGLLYFSGSIFYDEKEYQDLAQNLLAYGVYGLGPDQPSAFRPPGYVFFIAPFLATGYGKPAVILVQAVLWATNAYIASRLSLSCGGPVAAGVALVLALCFPIFAYTSLTVYPQTLTATLLLFSLFILFNYVSPPCPIWCIILLGFLSGVLILVTPPLSLILCSAAALSWFLKLIDLRRVAIAVVVAALTVSPWIGRNLVVIGAPTIATNGGINLLLGNSENTRAELGTNVDISRYLSEAQDLNEVERDAYFRAAALDWMTRNPADALELYLAKFFHFFDFHEQLATKSAQSKMAPLVMFVSYYPLLLLATLTILLSVRGSSRKEFLLGIIYVASAATYAIFFTRLRFRVPFDYLVIILAAIATSRLLDRPRFRRSTSNAPSDPSCASPDGISYDLNTPSRHEEARC